MRVLTVAVPIFNMDWCLERNLETYVSPRLGDRLQVICLNNASRDRSREIISAFAARYPETFTPMDRPGRGYGSSINAALAAAEGRYFRIIDADDWVDTAELEKLLDALEAESADVVLTDYRVVDMSTGEETPMRAGDRGAPYGELLRSTDWPRRTLPSIHNTTYRTALLRDMGFQMPDERFFVDEAYVILPYLRAETVIYYPYDVYRYQVANPEQSTSPKNRAKYLAHREANLKDILGEYRRARGEEKNAPALEYCRKRLIRGLGDHFTTLYMYVPRRKEGRRLAKDWRAYLLREAPELWPRVRRKAGLLWAANRLGLSLEAYRRLKARVLRR